MRREGRAMVEARRVVLMACVSAKYVLLKNTSGFTLSTGRKKANLGKPRAKAHSSALVQITRSPSGAGYCVDELVGARVIVVRVTRHSHRRQPRRLHHRHLGNAKPPEHRSR